LPASAANAGGFGRGRNFFSNLAYIGSDFNAEHREEFDSQCMPELYDYAYKKAVNGFPRDQVPPGYKASK
jgi:hypothetical protein